MSKSGKKVSAEKAGPSTPKASKWSTRKETLLVGLIQQLKGHRKIRKNSFWTTIERKKIFKFTAQEMKTHFFKVVRPKLIDYITDKTEIHKFHGITPAKKSGNQKITQGSPPYTEAETGVIKWKIVVNTGKVNYLGTTFWKKIETELKGTAMENRGWQSMKDHFIKDVLPVLEISRHHEDKEVLQKLHKPTPPVATNDAIAVEKPVEKLRKVNPVGSIASVSVELKRRADVVEPSVAPPQVEQVKQSTSNHKALETGKITSVGVGIGNQAASATTVEAPKLQIKKPNSTATSTNNQRKKIPTNGTEFQTRGPKIRKEEQALKQRVERMHKLKHNIKIMHRLTDHGNQRVRQIAETTLCSFIEGTRHAQITLDQLDATGKESVQFMVID